MTLKNKLLSLKDKILENVFAVLIGLGIGGVYFALFVIDAGINAWLLSSIVQVTDFGQIMFWWFWFGWDQLMMAWLFTYHTVEFLLFHGIVAIIIGVASGIILAFSPLGDSNIDW